MQFENNLEQKSFCYIAWTTDWWLNYCFFIVQLSIYVDLIVVGPWLMCVQMLYEQSVAMLKPWYTRWLEENRNEKSHFWKMFYTSDIVYRLRQVHKWKMFYTSVAMLKPWESSQYMFLCSFQAYLTLQTSPSLPVSCLPIPSFSKSLSFKKKQVRQERVADYIKK